MFRRTLAMSQPAGTSSPYLGPYNPPADLYPQDAFTSALRNHAHWRAALSASDPGYFPTLAKGQAPKILWLGCSDSRIPAEQLLGLKPGDLFVHRNIANVLSPTDLSSVSVVEFAVRHLKVEHAVVCGHTGCGGVAAALGQKSLGVLDQWLQPVRTLRVSKKAELEQAQDKGRKLAELNVLNSLETLKMNPTVIEAMKERGMKLHGLIFNIETGALEEVAQETDGEQEKLDVYTLQ